MVIQYEMFNVFQGREINRITLVGSFNDMVHFVAFCKREKLYNRHVDNIKVKKELDIKTEP